ncbi:flagellar hook-basal body protein [Desulfosoma caldarium]|uniref:Flagellar basal-body rod protein FlgG n=1 Tax=Desulfosoma caldarium TaxID=610254 RepID=A0A3N1VGD2_9BACT|nr:flagellar hook basal-body protein [Desulfosoma caldarium]ROR01894.1 flagellar basal-body rod protein FlgG [Desulfosoma caldarium]
MRLSPYTSVLGAIQQEKRMEVIANNLANGATPGYRRVGTKFTNFMELETYMHTTQGPVRRTGNPLDVAINGQGYFRIQTDRGERYTRAGNFTIDAQGRLVTPEGWPVLGQGGIIQLESSNVRIDSSGQVFDGDNAVDTLDVVDFGANVRLVHDERNLLMPSDPNAFPMPAQNYTLEQGALEGANFSAVQEMTSMIETLRIFEACQKVMKISHDQDQQLINQLAKS